MLELVVAVGTVVVAVATVLLMLFAPNELRGAFRRGMRWIAADLRRHEDHLHTGDVSAVSFPLERFGLPTVVYAGSVEHRYKKWFAEGKWHSQIGLHWCAQADYAPPVPVSGRVRSLGDAVFQARSKGRSVWDGPLVRPVDIIQRNLPTSLGLEWPHLDIEIQRTSYRQFLGSNASLDDAELTDVQGLSQEDVDALRHAELRADSSGEDLAASILANPLSVNIVIVTRDNFMLIQERSRKVGAGTVTYQTSAAGFVYPERDLDPGTNQVSPWRAATEEIREETGLEVKEEEVQFLGVVRELLRKREVGLVGFVRLKDLDYRGEGGLVLPYAKDTNVDVRRFVAIPFDCKSVLGFVLSHVSSAGDYWSNVMPLGALSWLFALAAEQGGWNRVLDVWLKLRKGNRDKY